MTSMIPEPQMPVTPVSPAASAKSGASDHGSTPMTRKRGSRVVPVDADALDGAGRSALAAADLGALEGRAGRAGRGEQATLVAEDDLGVRADVHDERHPIRLVRLLGQDDAGRVGADVARDARQDVDPRARVGPEPQLRRGRVDRTVGRQGERRAAERRRIDAEQEVMHDRVADQRKLQDVGALDPGLVGEQREHPVDRQADRLGHLLGALGMHHRVRDAAHEVLAEADLRVHHARAREHGAVGQVREVAGDGRGADVDRDPVDRVVETGPDRDDVPSTVDGHGHGVLARLERRLERLHDLQVRLEVRELPLALEGFEQARQVAGG